MIEEESKYLLSETSFFKELTKEDLDILINYFESIHILGGDVLIKEGDEADALYMVVSGRLRVVKNKAGVEEIVGEIGRGELVGEFALLTKKKRTATVFAIRDSYLLKLSKEAFNKFCLTHPQQLLEISSSTILRLLETKPKMKGEYTTLAIFPASNSENYQNFSLRFSKELSKFGSTMLINKETIKNHLRVDLDDDYSYLKEEKNISSWLSQQENHYRFIIYVGDDHSSSWSQLCMRQADRILLVGTGEGDRDLPLNNTEKALLTQAKELRKSIDLIILHADTILFPSGTANWLNLRPVANWYHIKMNSSADFQRLARIYSGNIVALVLGGGGAASLAHFGVYKALMELGIPVDIIGGSSAGSVVASFCAMGYSIDEIVKIFKSLVPKGRKNLVDYTLPIISIISGKKLEKVFKKAYKEDFLIEDLWKSFFCITANLSRYEIEVIQKGLLWKAIRASISLPAILPPVTNENNELLVDGGIMNNLPVDVMRHVIGKGKIIASKIVLSGKIHGDWPGGSYTLLHLLSQHYSGKIDIKKVNIFEIISESIMLGSRMHCEQATLEADACIETHVNSVSFFDFDLLDAMIKVGYKSTMEKSDHLKILK